ncbi:hypothetical protein PYCCODRAFT_1440718 [Trametes coccinea BRFM310]|uniref:F-box domain-containing protein n=1 Tax=Trametes coccinea (strain BRFM310) TaxID=1353009 RepID=A0A1Y2IAE5_TRAC3|nr:hypothetical protein PYCCODRAFT_1440718 [Trametes coccinea BRFM310]
MADHATEDALGCSSSRVFIPTMEQLAQLHVQRPDPQSSIRHPEPLALKFKENASAPINMLPVELMVNVFLALDDWSSRGVHFNWVAKWMRAMLVCRRWREVIASNPCFWRTIVVSNSIEWLDLSISRSMGANLHLYCHRPTVLISFLPQILAQSDRIEVLCLYQLTPADLLGLCPLLSTPFPALAVLRVDHDYQSTSDPGDARYQLDEAYFPNLTNLKLHHAGLPWCPALLSHLRSLHLQRCTISPSTFSLAAFLDVLEYGIQLETLIICNSMSSACQTLHAPSHRTRKIVLPRLHRLDIRDATDCVVSFLTFVQVPISGNVFIGAQTHAADPDTFKRLGLFGAATRARLWIVPCCFWDLRLVSSGPTPLDISLRSYLTSAGTSDAESVDNGMRFLKDVLHGVPLEGLALMFPPVLFNPDVFEPLLDAFPRLQALEMGDHQSDPHHIRNRLPTSFFRLLRRPPSSPTAPSLHNPQRLVVRCPHLKALRLGWMAWNGGKLMEDLVHCLMTRAHRGAPKLETLVLRTERRDHSDWPRFGYDDEPEKYSRILRSLARTCEIDIDVARESTTHAWAHWDIDSR